MQGAWEEGGVIGTLDAEPLGIYEEDRNGIFCRTEVFALRVDEQNDTWPEVDMRERKWLDADAAITFVSSPGLAELMAKLKA